MYRPVASSMKKWNPFVKEQPSNGSPEPKGHGSLRGKGVRPISLRPLPAAPQVVWEVVWRFRPIS